VRKGRNEQTKSRRVCESSGQQALRNIRRFLSPFVSNIIIKEQKKDKLSCLFTRLYISGVSKYKWSVLVKILQHYEVEMPNKFRKKTDNSLIKYLNSL